MFSTSHLILITIIVPIVICHLVKKRHIDFRERFLQRKLSRQLNDRRINEIDNFIFKDTAVVDDIMHYRNQENNSSMKWEKIKAVERDFRRLIAMKGMKYDYKRDFYWRTWRSVEAVNGGSHLVCYKCHSPSLVVNSTGCQNCGMWTIEEVTPPCPYEFFSVISDQRLCGANYTQFNDLTSACPSVIKFSDLTATCDNPIETVWRFSKMYGIPDYHENIICDGKDFCEIFTTYDITPEHVIFRIINSTNDVMYSRVMKPNNINYICIDDCGRFNTNTRKVTKLDKPLKLDLLSPPKQKREDAMNEITEDIHLTTASIIHSEKEIGTTLSKFGGKGSDKKKVKNSFMHKIMSKSAEKVLYSLEGRSFLERNSYHVDDNENASFV